MRRTLPSTALAVVALVTAPVALAATSSQDTSAHGLWGLDMSDQRDGGIDGQYHHTSTGAGVTVYMVDTGVDASHPDIAARMRPGFDAWGGGSASTDCQGHGTAMASLAAGTVGGIAKQAAIVPVRVQGCDYTSRTDAYVRGLQWVVDHHLAGTPAVANLSFDELAEPTLDAAVQRLVDDGITVVAAAGNLGEGHGGDNCHVSPARMASVVRVGGVQRDADDHASWYAGGLPGSCIDLLAPAYNVTVATPGGGTGLGWGTSEATALATGTAALVLQQHPSWTPAQVKASLMGTASTGVVRNLPAGVPNRLLDALAASQDAGPAPTPAPALAAPSPARPTTAPAPTAPRTFRIAWAPRLSGTATVGERLTTDQGGWIPGGSRTTVWYRVKGSTWIGKGAGTSAVVDAVDVGHQIVACTTARATGHAPLTSCSARSDVVRASTRLANTSTPSITGTMSVGGLATASAGSWTPTGVVTSIQWYRESASGATSIAGATGRSYRPVAADRAMRLRVRVVGALNGHVSATAWSATSAPVR